MTSEVLFPSCHVTANPPPPWPQLQLKLTRFVLPILEQHVNEIYVFNFKVHKAEAGQSDPFLMNVASDLEAKYGQSHCKYPTFTAGTAPFTDFQRFSGG